MQAAAWQQQAGSMRASGIARARRHQLRQAAAVYRRSDFLTCQQLGAYVPVRAGFLTGDCGAKLPPRLAPLRSRPAVEVLRGSEAGLPNGCASVAFESGVMGLAGLLARDPRVVLELWHKEKCAAAATAAGRHSRCNARAGGAHAASVCMLKAAAHVCACCLLPLQAALGRAAGRGKRVAGRAAAGVLGGRLRASACDDDQGGGSSRAAGAGGESAGACCEHEREQHAMHGLQGSATACCC